LRGREEIGQHEFAEDMVIIEETYWTPMEENHELIEEGGIPLTIPISITNSDQRIYEWKMQ